MEAERKSVYRDIALLKEYGMDIVCQKGKTVTYFLASRTFELPELKLLVDAVQSSKFITARKSEQLIKKHGNVFKRVAGVGPFAPGGGNQPH